MTVPHLITTNGYQPLHDLETSWENLEFPGLDTLTLRDSFNATTSTGPERDGGSDWAKRRGH